MSVEKKVINRNKQNISSRYEVINELGEIYEKKTNSI